jgi:hypothetical protein
MGGGGGLLLLDGRPAVCCKIGTGQKFTGENLSLAFVCNYIDTKSVRKPAGAAGLSRLGVSACTGTSGSVFQFAVHCHHRHAFRLCRVVGLHAIVLPRHLSISSLSAAADYPARWMDTHSV